MKTFLLCIMLPIAFPFMILGSLWKIIKAGFETGYEMVGQIGRKYL